MGQDICNIGRKGRLIRRVAGLAFLIASIALHPAAGPFIIIPLFIGYVCLLESRMSFCVYYAYRGKYTLSGEYDRNLIPAGRARARAILTYGIILALATKLLLSLA
ncbi:MAG: DUF2892 domain-containing protein [Candidatus Aenigmarchaeota archaeon]|nr:DUF2892 domain-containing protein [Candidatus Aenigmarchaeota archaeon]